MIFDTITIACDEKGCQTKKTDVPWTGGKAEVLLRAQSEGWTVILHPTKAWEHFCPEHKP